MGTDLVSWWVASLPRSLVWARLTLRESGSAEVLGSDGRVLHYHDDDAARSALMDAEYRAFDGLDEDDAKALGFVLGEVEPPAAEDDDKLVPLLIQKI